MKKIKNRHMGMLGIAIIAFSIFGFFQYKGSLIKEEIHRYDIRIASLEEQLEEEKDRTGDLEQLKEYMKTDDYIEEIARNRLGLVKENEIVFKEKK